MSYGYVFGTDDGLYDIDGRRVHESAISGRKVSAIAQSRDGYVCVVDGNEVWRCDAKSAVQVTSSDLRLNCIADVGGTILAGAEDARITRFDENAMVRIVSFDAIPEREEWSTPWGGPPDVRSIAVSGDGTIYGDIHVGWIVRSTDGGESWVSCRTGLEKDVHQVSTHPSNDNIVCAATARGFYISNDGGDSFTRKTGELPYYYQRACVVFEKSDIYLASTSRGPHGDCEARLFRTVDGGESWAEVSGLPNHVAHNIDTFQLACSPDGRVVVAVENSELYVSNDYGQTFRAIGTHLPYIHAICYID